DLPVPGSGHLDVSAVAGDHDIRPSVRLQLLLHLFRSHRAVACNENRSGALLRSRDPAHGSEKQRAADDTCHDSIHRSSPSWYTIHRRSAAEPPAFKAELIIERQSSLIRDPRADINALRTAKWVRLFPFTPVLERGGRGRKTVLNKPPHLGDF